MQKVFRSRPGSPERLAEEAALRKAQRDVSDPNNKPIPYADPVTTFHPEDPNADPSLSAFSPENPAPSLSNGDKEENKNASNNKDAEDADRPMTNAEKFDHERKFLVDGENPAEEYFDSEIDPIAPINPRTGRPVREGATRYDPQSNEFQRYKNGYGYCSVYEWTDHRFMKDMEHIQNSPSADPLAPRMRKDGYPRRDVHSRSIQNLTNRRGQIVYGRDEITNGKGIGEMWCHLFEENERVPLEQRVTDDELTAIMIAAFPQKAQGKRIRDIVTMRSTYNGGRIPCQRGHTPALIKSYRYIRNDDGAMFKLTPRGHVIETNMPLDVIAEVSKSRVRQQTKDTVVVSLPTGDTATNVGVSFQDKKQFNSEITKLRRMFPDLLPKAGNGCTLDAYRAKQKELAASQATTIMSPPTPPTP